MISRIQNEPKLKSCIRYEIEDEGIEVGIDKKDSLKVDNNLGRKIYKFRNRFLTIQYEIPPNPVIHKTT